MNPPLDTNSKDTQAEKFLIHFLGSHNSATQSSVRDCGCVQALLQTAHNSALDEVRERMPEKQDKVETFDNITKGQDGAFVDGFNDCLKQVLAILEEMKS